MAEDSCVAYEYDVFLSYSRSGQWEKFVDESFEPILAHWLGEELGRSPIIFKDRSALSIGQNWPVALEEALRASRVMVALWSRQYFASEWCRRELSFMMARARAFKERGIFDGIILPAIIHDGRTFPPFLAFLQGINLAEYADPFMTIHSILREKLSGKLQELSRDTAAAIEAVSAESIHYSVDYKDDLASFSYLETRQISPPSLGGVA
jgi:hypothetical protein